MNKGILALAATTLTLLVAGSAQASILTYFGEDANPGSSTTHSDTAHTQFLNNLASSVGTEDFESVSSGTYNLLGINFPGSAGSITATLTGSSMEICAYNGCGGSGRFAISGTHYLDTSTQFNLAFSSPVSAFGFYGTDIGDFGGRLTLMLTGGGTATLTIPTSLGSSGSSSGQQIFFGFIDPTLSYSGIQFGNTSGGSDFFGFDNMIIGDLQQVQLSVPEPGSFVMLGLGLLGLYSLLLLRRRAIRSPVRETD